MLTWTIPFIDEPSTAAITHSHPVKRALIILNQPFSATLFERVWNACEWRCCADGGANRLFDLMESPQYSDIYDPKNLYMPDLIKGDLDSIRPCVREFYGSKGVTIIEDPDQDATDLMKCVDSIVEKEKIEADSYDIILLGGLSGRLDQSVHTLHYLHKIRKTRPRVFVVTDENVGWVLDEGEHLIHINHDLLGPSCGLLPVGVDCTVLSTSGLRWNLTERQSSFDGLVSTSNHLVPEESTVWVKTSRPIWWCVELTKLNKTNAS